MGYRVWFDAVKAITCRICVLLQWIDNVLSKGDKVEFFHDEYRCPVYVKDLVAIILNLTDRWVSGSAIASIYRCLVQYREHEKQWYFLETLFCNTVLYLVSDGKQMQLVLNAGGPNRLSRVQMAEAVAEVRGHNLSLIKPISASSVSESFIDKIANCPVLKSMMRILKLR